MTWLVENGRRIVGSLAPVFNRDDLHVGQEVQIVREQGRKLSRAIIERVHRVSTNGQQGSVHSELCTSDDGKPLSKECSVFSSRVCAHVRYRNGVRAVIDVLAFIRPSNSRTLVRVEDTNGSHGR